jgi:hypothetical protein
MPKKNTLQKYKDKNKLLLADKKRLLKENEFLQSLLSTMTSIEEQRANGGFKDLLSRDILSFLEH